MDDSLINGYENDGSLQEFRTYLVPDIKKRIQDVQRKLDFWHRLLKDLDKKKSKGSSEHYLEREIRDFVSRLQNVLETYFNEVQRRRGRSIIGKCIDEFKFFQMADLDVKEINMQIRMTSWYLNFLGALSQTETQSANENPETEIRRKLRRSIFDSGENDIVVKDPRLQTLKSSLLDGKDRVIRIYGRGGIGKTALAHRLYSSPTVQSRFDICSVVEIGPEFAVRNVLESILVQLPEGRERMKQPNLTLEAVAEHFKEYGKNIRYLFVLDDIRSLDDWNLLRRIFPKNQKGSKLMLTTRLADVAFSVDEDEPDGLDEQDALDEPDGFVHVMRRLSPFDSFQLFQKTFSRDPYAYAEVDSLKNNIKRQVLKCCMGLPSAIVAVGEVLAKRRTSHEWEMVLRDIKLLIDRGQPVEQIISQKSISDLIFDDLPYHLKPCFLYLGLFPKGSKIEVEHLYLQWMAEGMISRDDCQENETMMDLAERYLSDLVQRKIVEVEEEEEEIPSLRKYKSCQIHEHVKDHCLQKGEEYFFKVLDNRSSDSLSLTTNPARGMALHLGKEDDRSSVDQLRNGKVDHLRSLLLLSPQDLQVKLEWPRRMFNLKRYRMLRVLTFERVEFQERGLPSEMTWPIYLRYLSFKGCILGVLPASIGNLSFLETLDLRVSSKVIIIIPNVLRQLGKLVSLYLPLEFKTQNNDKLYLKSLKEIEILENFHTGMCNVADLFKMMKLRHLSTTVEGNLGDLKQIVRRMDMTSENTSVSIKVKNFDCYTEERHSVFRELLRCQILHTLHMDGHLGQIPPRYEITTRLTEMVLIGSQLKEDPMTTLDKLPELQVLVLQNDAFDGKKMVCAESSFMKLKRLELSTLRFLETWEVEEGSLPVLSIVAVKNCRKLQILPDELRNRVPQITFEIVSELISKDGLKLKKSGSGT
ncbi:probable disease resistance RF45 isoform X1 [Olea europaea subsp. europaea]|uniref:Probable disease resistance RF45 isoform X1 n=1 Tax=Olea europaea subsp. europaea TaxID=158383 RepID=A0A8S0UW44_OLEEU|nr:probable disease resistance RF45 isoform X1 [Olea europaea subsp. europaea]